MNTPPLFSVFCWDGWQRGHIADCEQQKTAEKIAKAEAKTGLLGDIYYVQRIGDRIVIAEFEAGCV